MGCCPLQSALLSAWDTCAWEERHLDARSCCIEVCRAEPGRPGTGVCHPRFLHTPDQYIPVIVPSPVSTLQQLSFPGAEADVHTRQLVTASQQAVQSSRPTWPCAKT